MKNFSRLRIFKMELDHEELLGLIKVSNSVRPFKMRIVCF